MPLVNFENIGFYQTALPETSLIPVQDEIAEIQKNFDNPMPIDMNRRLAGNIAREYEISDVNKSYIDSMLQPHIKKYLNNNATLDKILHINSSKPLKLKTCWVNFQKKHEFNPVHIHDGELSFVLWVKIPFTYENELENKSVKYSLSPLPGAFSFFYTGSLGDIMTHIIHADSSYERTLLLFPSKLSHSVYPFYTSDEYRISISGNFA
jgi:hypothetical protein